MTAEKINALGFYLTNILMSKDAFLFLTFSQNQNHDVEFICLIFLTTHLTLDKQLTQ